MEVYLNTLLNDGLESSPPDKGFRLDSNPWTLSSKDPVWCRENCGREKSPGQVVYESNCDCGP